jgi:predicted PurR-regulated permease PerM
MDIVDIIKEAINFPLTDYKGWGMVAVITLIIGIFQQLTILYPDYSTILAILSFFVAILLMGVNLSILRATIDGKNQIPVIDPVKNFIDGLKNLVVNAIYYVIPAILVFIISIIAGVYSNTEKFILALNLTNVANSSASNMLSTVPADVTNALFISVAIVTIVGFVLFVLFALLNIIAQARLAQTGNIFEAINIRNVIQKISSIGWANYILFIILLLITIFVFGLVSGLITLIPYVGAIISSVVVESYLMIVISRAVGLVYNQG